MVEQLTTPLQPRSSPLATPGNPSDHRGTAQVVEQLRSCVEQLNL